MVDRDRAQRRVPSPGELEVFPNPSPLIPPQSSTQDVGTAGGSDSKSNPAGMLPPPQHPRTSFLIPLRSPG